MIPKIINNLLTTFFTLLDTPTRFKIPNIIYAIGIFVYFLQCYSNLFHLEYDNNWFIILLSQFAQDSTIIHLIEKYDKDLLFWLAYAIIHLPIALLIFLTILVGSKRQEYMTLFNYVSGFYNIWISWFPIAFYEVYIEFNLHLAFSKNIYLAIYGVLGTGTTILAAQAFCYISQCYEFNDINLYKRKISLMSFGLVIKAVLIIITNFKSENIKILCIVLVLLFCLLTIYDSLFFRPFQNTYLTKLYITNSFVFFSATIIQSLLMLDVINQSNILYLVIGICPLAANLGMCFYEDILINLIQNIDIELFWIYSQQLIFMYSDQNYKFIIYVSLRNQINQCTDPICYCAKYGKNLKLDNNSQSIVNGNKDQSINYRCLRELNLKFDDIVQLLDSMFRRILNDKQLKRKDRLNFIYVSFLEKYSGNKLMSYYYLKYQHLQSKQSSSLFYKLIYNVVLKVLQQINQKLETRLSYSNKILQEQANKEKTIQCLPFESVIKLEKICDALQDSFVKILNSKIVVWAIIEKGCEHISEFIRNIVKPLANIVKEIKNLDNELQILEQDYDNSGYLKIVSLRYLIIYNSFGKVIMFEQKVHELKMKDQYRDDTELNNYNLMQAQNTLIKVGLIKKFGQILKKNNDRIKLFFGFNDEEVNKIQNINEFMPPHISTVHNYIICQYIQNGSSPLFYENRKLYLMNKQKFMFPVSLTIRDDFTNMDDCTFNVNLLKVTFQDIIMFDSHGKILGMSEKLYHQISNSKTLFTYEQLLERGLIQILMPNFIKIIEDIQKQPSKEYLGNMNSVYENLQCSIHSNANFISTCSQYRVNLEDLTQFSRQSTQHKSLGLFDEKERKLMAELLKEEKGLKNNSVGFHVRFDIYQFHRDFSGISKVFIDLIGQQNSEERFLSYFILDIKEVDNSDQRQHQSASSISQGWNTLQQTFSKPSASQEIQISNEKEEEFQNQSDEKGKLEFHFSENKLPQSLKFSIESPRMQIETPKETDRMMMYDNSAQKASFIEKKSNFYSRMLKGDEKKSSKFNDYNHPRYISKNEIQDEGIKEFEQEIEQDKEQQIVPEHRKQKQQAKMVFYISTMKQTKQKKILDEQQSTTSGVSKAERENLEQIYQNTKMPIYFYWYAIAQIIIIMIPLFSVIVQSVVIVQQLENIITVSNHLLIPYKLNRVFVNPLQQELYLHSAEFQKENYDNFKNYDFIFKESINQSIIEFRDLINEEVDQYIQVSETDIESKAYEDENTYIINNLYLYDYLVSTYQLTKDSDKEIAFLELISRMFAITETTDVINDFQVLNIENGIDYLIKNVQFIIFATISLIFLPLIPYLLYLNILNKFQTMIILLVTRVNYDEYVREIKRLDSMIKGIQDLRGLNVITNQFVNQFINSINQKKENKQKAKQNVLQSKIYNLKISKWQELSFLIVIYSSIIMLLVGGMIFSNQIPDIYLPTTDLFIHHSHEFMHIQHYNLLNEIVVNKYTNQSLSEIEKIYAEALESYSMFPLPFEQEEGDLDYLNSIYFSDLCENSTFSPCQNDNFRKNYQNGLNGVISQIKLLFNKEQFQRYTSDEYWALVVFFPAFIEPFLDQVLEAKNNHLSNYIQSLETGCLLYLLSGGFGLLLFCSIYFFKQSQQLYFRIYLLRHLLMFIPYEKFNEQITISLLKQIKEF